MTGCTGMDIETTPLTGVVLIRPKVFGDGRGFFMESWNKRSFAEAGITADFVQDNHSRSRQGILRGMHAQTQHTQGKLVRVTEGEVFDVAIDLRADSPTRGQWYGCILTGAGHEMLWVPPGFAHGFYVTSETADFQYKCTDYYAPEHERCIRWDDPGLGIDWPVTGQPRVSDKDEQGVAFSSADCFD